jgi:superfamily I DNA and RNA helicase
MDRPLAIGDQLIYKGAYLFEVLKVSKKWALIRNVAYSHDTRKIARLGIVRLGEENDYYELATPEKLEDMRNLITLRNLRSRVWSRISIENKTDSLTADQCRAILSILEEGG